MDDAVALIIFGVTAFMVTALIVLNTWAWIDERRAKATDDAAYYVEPNPAQILTPETPFSAFERPEPPPFVQPVQHEDDVERVAEHARLDVIARLMAAGVVAESSAITAVYDGTGGLPKVSKGGSAAYVARRDAVRYFAIRYGWQPPELRPAGQATPIAGRPVPPGVRFEADGE